MCFIANDTESMSLPTYNQREVLPTYRTNERTAFVQ